MDAWIANIFKENERIFVKDAYVLAIVSMKTEDICLSEDGYFIDKKRGCQWKYSDYQDTWDTDHDRLVSKEYDTLRKKYLGQKNLIYILRSDLSTEKKNLLLAAKRYGIRCDELGKKLDDPKMSPTIIVGSRLYIHNNGGGFTYFTENGDMIHPYVSFSIDDYKERWTVNYDGNLNDLDMEEIINGTSQD